MSKASVPANEKLVFQKECQDFLVASVAKTFEKSPLRNKVKRAVACIVPATMINARSISEKRMEMLVQILFEKKWLSAVLLIKPKHSSHNYVLKHQKNGYKCSQVLTGTRNV